MKTFVMGDVHGAHKALLQCLERSVFNKEEDRLIILGDVCDGWCFVRECVEELLTIKNLITVIGNHDEWFKAFLTTGVHPDRWKQGGLGTAISYLGTLGKGHLYVPNLVDGGFTVALNPDDISAEHRKLFMNMELYYVDDNRLFVHAGFNRDRPIKESAQRFPWSLTWDRNLWEQARSAGKKQRLKTADRFAEIFIGHTSCSHIDDMKPVYCGGVWNLDTGAGCEGKLTIMDVDTKKYWQSDEVWKLYAEAGDHSMHFSKNFR